MAITAYNSPNNIGHHAERSASSLRADLPPQMPAALSPEQGMTSDFAGSSSQAQSTGNTGAGATAFSLSPISPSIEAASITLRSRRVAPLALVSSRRRARLRYEDRNGHLVRIHPDGSTSPVGIECDRYEGAFTVAVQQATGLIKGGKTLPLDAITVLLTRIVVHMGEKERSCRLYRLPVVLALIGCPDASGVAPEEEAIARRANKTERAIAAAIRSLCLDGGEMKSLARRQAGIEVREIRTTKGGK
ncbi:hypothetical protein [Armatimonas rosea]|uniref:Uncharacterized protein n=1 Tax=Armatimonas rosea TaxID=685828 RepID=A0A7W9SUW2_ARMRO|nr:hypothetical protein [Armatimonas rosea]MBB6053261.1 hypothetical protein [Armatimonas rosea]